MQGAGYDKIAAISRVQNTVDIPKKFPATDLLALLLTLSAMGQECDGPADTQGAKRRRRVITEAVTALLER